MQNKYLQARPVLAPVGPSGKNICPRLSFPAKPTSTPLQSHVQIHIQQQRVDLAGGVGDAALASLATFVNVSEGGKGMS